MHPDTKEINHSLPCCNNIHSVVEENHELLCFPTGCALKPHFAIPSLACRNLDDILLAFFLRYASP